MRKIIALRLSTSESRVAPYPEDNVAEFAEEFDSKLKNKNNKTNHDKNQQSNKK